MKKLMLSAMVIGMAASVALCEDQVDNPQYKAWASYKAGTVVKTQSSGETTMGENKMTTKITMTSTLKEVTADKVVVEIATEMEMNGQKMSMPAKPIEIPAKVDKSLAGDMPAPKGVTATKKNEGDEEVAVGDKKYKCHWIEYQMTGQQEAGGTKIDVDTTVKVWKTSDMPGGVAKMVTDSTKPAKSKMTMAVTEFKAAS